MMEGSHAHTVRVHMVEGTHDGGYTRWRLHMVESIHGRVVEHTYGRV